MRFQSAPSATTDTTLYTVPKKYSARGRVYVCERGGAAATFRIAIRKGGAVLANEHYIVYDAALAANEATSTDEIDSLDADDVITIRASTANCSFSFFGVERQKP